MLASSQCSVSLPCSDTDWFVIGAFPGHTQVLYGNLVNKFKRIMEKLFFPDQFKKITKNYKRVGYNTGAIMSVRVG